MAHCLQIQFLAGNLLCSYVNVAILVYVFIADHRGNFRIKFPNNIAWFLAGFTSSEQWVDLKISKVFVINQ